MSKIYDVSFAGSTITIGGIQVQDFMDDANPVEFSDTEVCQIEWDCNGCIIQTIKPSPIIASVTVIPGSASDKGLRGLWRKSCVNEGGISLDEAETALEMTIAPGNSHIPSFSFSRGCCISGTPGITVRSDGKTQGNTYTFAFAKYSV